MAAVRALAAAALALALATPGRAALTQAELDHAVARPPRDARLPAMLPFTDQQGAATTLGAVADGRPLVLLFADYTCRHVCGPGTTLTAAALRASGLIAGRDYSLAIVGLDPHDGVARARAFAANIAQPEVARAATLLVGTPASVAAARRALGYGIAYDKAADQFAHDASLYVFAADGRLTALLPELGVRPAALRAALAGAPVPSVGERIARLCYGLAAAHGRFGQPVALALQGLALATLAGLGVAVLRSRRA